MEESILPQRKRSDVRRVTIQSLLTRHAHRFMPLSHRRFSLQQYSSQRHFSTTRQHLSLHPATRMSSHESLRHHSLWLKSSLAWSGNQRHGGYAGDRVGEAVNPRAATHERDWADEQPDPTHRRINEARDSVPSSQDSVTRAVQNLRNSDSPATTMALPAPPVPEVGNTRRQPRPRTTAQRVPPLCTVRLKPSCSRCLF